MTQLAPYGVRVIDRTPVSRVTTQPERAGDPNAATAGAIENGEGSYFRYLHE